MKEEKKPEETKKEIDKKEQDIIKEEKEEKEVVEKPKPVEKKSSHEKATLIEKMRGNPWILSTLVLGIITLVLITGNFSGNMAGNVISGDVVSAEVAGNAILELAESQVSGGAELIKVNEKSGLYEVILFMNGREVPVYVTMDGENLIGGLTPLSILKQQNTESPEQTQPTNIPKSDKPKVELFVMTHCPYGTQSEKGLIPTIKALGNTIDAKIRFVHYFMHEPEETETPRQVCIREEQPDKWFDYLECFLEDGDSDRCLSEAKIDKAKMQSCISTGKSDEYYQEDSELSQSYGVGGSPTLIINGVKSSAGRDSASYLAGICAAFNDAPEACTQQLSTTSPSPGFGWEGTSSGTSASCG